MDIKRKLRISVFQWAYKICRKPAGDPLKMEKPEVLGMITKYALISTFLDAQKPSI